MNFVVRTEAFEDGGEVVIVQVLERRLDARVAAEFKTKATALSAGKERLIIDLSDVEFLDSSGLGTLIAVLKQLGPRGDLILCGVQAPVMDLLELTRLERVFRFAAEPEEALQLLTAQS